MGTAGGKQMAPGVQQKALDVIRRKTNEQLLSLTHTPTSSYILLVYLGITVDASWQLSH